MTSPIKTRIVVTVNIQRSTLTRLAIEIPFHHGDTKTCMSFAGDFGQGITELVPGSLCCWWSAGRPRPATLVPERARRPSLHRYEDRDIASECTVSLNTRPRCS